MPESLSSIITIFKELKLLILSTMAKLLVLRLCFVLIASSFLFHVGGSITHKSQDGTEEWGYVQVRPSKSNSLIFILFYFSHYLLYIYSWDCVVQKPICFGGFIEVLREWTSVPSHGQPFSGYKADR